MLGIFLVFVMILYLSCAAVLVHLLIGDGMKPIKPETPKIAEPCYYTYEKYYCPQCYAQGVYELGKIRLCGSCGYRWVYEPKPVEDVEAREEYLSSVIWECPACNKDTMRYDKEKCVFICFSCCSMGKLVKVEK